MTEVRDAFDEAIEKAHDLEKLGLVGFGVIELRSADGELKDIRSFANLITDTGDLYYAQKAIVGIAPAAPSAPTAMAHMKLGTGTTAVAKNGAGAAIVTYIASSSQAFDASYPQTSNLGAGAGVTAVYKVTWAAGSATNSAITEAVITSDTVAANAGTASNSIARTVFSAVNKGASDTLAITWSHKFLGAP